MIAQQAVFPLVPGTKLPAIKQWQLAKPGEYPAVGNHGLVLTPSDLILDADPRNYPVETLVTGNPRIDVLSLLLSRFPIPPTKIVKTPSGGAHIYLSKPPGMAIRKHQPDYPGIDFLSDGCYVVCPGSSTDKGAYVQQPGPTEPAPAPPAMLAALLAPARPQSAGITEPTLLMEGTFKTECEISEPATRGSRGISAFKRAAAGRDYGLPLDVTYQHMRDSWLPRWAEPFTDDELLTQCEHAYDYAKNAPGCKTPEAVFTSDMAPPAATQPAPAKVISMDEHKRTRAINETNPHEYLLNKDGTPKKTLANVVHLLMRSAPWQFKFNEFSSDVEFSARPHWRENQMNCGLEVNARDFSNIKNWFSSTPQLECSDKLLEDGLSNAQVSVPYHPVREYLDSLEWDGIARLDSILIDTAGAEESPYTRDVGKCVMISAVKRIYEPGCKHDYLLVLEGSQGRGKSTWIATLGGQWYCASELVRSDKDTYQNLRGRWFVELPEINATFRKADFAWLKGIISNPVDMYRASYGKTSRPVPRESVFIGSINPNAGGEYLKDDENRRYWPVQTGEFNLARLERDRDQYFAEAVVRYRAGEATWLIDKDVQRMARQEQARRQEKDPWADILSEWIPKQLQYREQLRQLAIERGEAYDYEVGFSPNQIYAALSLNGTNIQRHHRQRVYDVMRTLGYEHKPELGTGGRYLAKAVDWKSMM